MPSEVTLTVRSQLLKVIEELDKIDAKGQQVADTLKAAGVNIGDSLNKQTKKTQTFMQDLTSLGRRAADQLKGDFKALLSINAVSQSLKLSEQFKGSFAEAMKLNDVIRKLGTSFGLAGKDYSKFQSDMLKGLGELGLATEAGANAMQGLAGTGVKGSARVVGYAQKSGQLASLSNTTGQEGEIAKGMAEVLRARGTDVNSNEGDKQMSDMAEDLRRAYNQTGKSPAEMLGTMKELFTGMSQDFRKSISSRGLVSMAAAAQTAGPNSTKFIEDMLGNNPTSRKAFEAQGGKGIFTNQGIDVEKFKVFSKAILARVGGDPRLAAKTLGLSDEAAEGFVRLSESLDKVKTAQEGIQQSTGSVEEQYKSSMGAGEAFRASINRVKSMVAGPLSTATQGISSILSGASGSNTGSLATVAGGGVLAALMAGQGLKGMGGAMGVGGIAKGAAIEAATGRQVTPVYVVNASDIATAAGEGPGGSAGKMAGGMMGKIGKVAKGAMAVGGAYELGSAIGSDINQIPGVSEAIVAGFDKVARLFGGGTMSDAEAMAKGAAMFKGRGAQQPTQTIKIELNKRELKETKQPTRGASY